MSLPPRHGFTGRQFGVKMTDEYTLSINLKGRQYLPTKAQKFKNKCCDAEVSNTIGGGIGIGSYGYC